MGFAEGYLQKHSIGEPLIQAAPDPKTHSIIAIPAYNESGLPGCLDSLFSCVSPEAPVEVIVLINSGAQTPRKIIDVNREAYRELVGWCNIHHRPGFTVHPLLLENLPKKHFGAGLARKLVMDEAARRFNQLDHPEGIILSLDADTRVEQNYLQEVTSIFDRSPETDGCSIRFAHPVGGKGDGETGRRGDGETLGPGDEETGRPGGREAAHSNKNFDPGVYPDAVYDAIVNYELHQRYYLEAVRFTGYPYAYHTVGSAFAVRAGAYCRQGGMSKRQAGEDFYFIQKIALQGNYTECNTTTVHPSPRPSDRVPFGTGPAIARQLETPDQPFLTYAPELFRHLETFYARIPDFYKSVSDFNASVSDAALSSLPDLMQNYLKSTGFLAAVSEIHGNVASEASFRQRFFRKFNMFWILKYLHFAGEEGVEKVEVGKAARQMLQMKESKGSGNPQEMSQMKKSKGSDNPREMPQMKKSKGSDKPRGMSQMKRENVNDPTRVMAEMKGGKAGDGLRHRELLMIYRKIQAVPPGY